MEPKVNRAQPSSRGRGLGRKRRVGCRACNIKLSQDGIRLQVEPAQMSWLQHCRALIELTKHIKEIQNSGFIKSQLGRQLQKQWSALFTKCAGLVQKAR